MKSTFKPSLYLENVKNRIKSIDKKSITNFVSKNRLAVILVLLFLVATTGIFSLEILANNTSKPSTVLGFNKSLSVDKSENVASSESKSLESQSTDSQLAMQGQVSSSSSSIKNAVSESSSTKSSTNSSTNSASNTVQKVAQQNPKPQVQTQTKTAQETESVPQNNQIQADLPQETKPATVSNTENSQQNTQQNEQKAQTTERNTNVVSSSIFSKNPNSYYPSSAASVEPKKYSDCIFLVGNRPDNQEVCYYNGKAFNRTVIHVGYGNQVPTQNTNSSCTPGSSGCPVRTFASESK